MNIFNQKISPLPKFLFSQSIIINTMADKKEQFSSEVNLNFLTDNMKGLQSSKMIIKRVEIIKFLRNKIARESILFLRERYSLVETKNNGVINLRANLFLSQTDSCGALTVFYGNVNVVIKKQNDKMGKF